MRSYRYFNPPATNNPKTNLWQKKSYLERLNVLPQVLVRPERIRVVLEGNVPRLVVGELDMNGFGTVFVREQGLQKNELNRV